MNTVNTRFGKDKISEMMSRVGTVFFVGIGGINMSSLAAITSSLGYNVKGSDRTRSPETDGLEAHGVTVYHTHDAKNVEGADALVYTRSRTTIPSTCAPASSAYRAYRAPTTSAG